MEKRAREMAIHIQQLENELNQIRKSQTPRAKGGNFTEFASFLRIPKPSPAINKQAVLEAKHTIELILLKTFEVPFTLFFLFLSSSLSFSTSLLAMVLISNTFADSSSEAGVQAHAPKQHPNWRPNHLTSLSYLLSLPYPLPLPHPLSLPSPLLLPYPLPLSLSSSAPRLSRSSLTPVNPSRAVSSYLSQHTRTSHSPSNFVQYL